MRCEDLAPRASRWADSDLNPEAAAELAQHLLSCPACSRHWQALQEAEAILGAATLVSPPDGFRQRVMAAVALERAPAGARQNLERRSFRLAIAAACIAAAFLATGAIVMGASLAWRWDVLASLAAQNVTAALVQVAIVLVSADALVRTIAVISGALPAPFVSGAVLSAILGAFAVIASWIWLVKRYGWSRTPLRA
jgi:anti-sigma factor RsiW